MLDISKLGQAAAESEDMTQDKSFERELPKEGVAYVRLLSYIETGRHEPKAGSTYKPSLKAILIFELSHKNHLIEIDGKKVPQQMMVRVNKGATSKSGFKKLFKSLDRALGGGHTHIMQMIGKPCMAKIYHNTTGEGEKAQTYANLDVDGAYSFQEPIMINHLLDEDDEGYKTTLPVPELHNTPTAFLWENESVTDEDIQAMWDSIFIDGVREVKDDKTGEMVEKSKNWIQEIIKTNLEWEGSRTQGIVEEQLDLDEFDTDGE